MNEPVHDNLVEDGQDHPAHGDLEHEEHEPDHKPRRLSEEEMADG